MGLTIDRERFEAPDYRRFERRLDECLVTLGRLLEQPGFGTGPTTVGAELELFLVDAQGRALPRNQEVRAGTADPRVVLEIDRFNLELNLTPAPLAGWPFAAMASELDQALGIVGRAAPWHGGRVAAPGAVPGPDLRGRPAGAGHRRQLPHLSRPPALAGDQGGPVQAGGRRPRRQRPGQPAGGPGRLPAGPPQLLPGRPVRPRGRAGLAAGPRRPGGHAPGGRAGPLPTPPGGAPARAGRPT
jgi:hypothetical protein